MRIAFVYDALYPFHKGGAERRVHEIAVRLAARHEVHLLSWRFAEGDPPPELDGLTLHDVGAAPGFYGADGRRTVREALAFATRAVPHLLRQRYDVIDCSATPYVPVYACRLASRLTRTPLVVTWHEFWGDYWESYLDNRPLVARAARLAEAGCRRMGDAAVAVSPFTAARLVDAGAGPGISVVPNGVSVAEIAGAARAEPATDLLFVGRLIADKRVDDLLHAVARLATSRPELQCRIVGDGPERTALERLAGELGVEANVTFLGHLPGTEVYGQLRSATVLVLPSVREGYGITVVEGQAAGAVPVVVRSPMSAAADLVRDGVDGVVCDPGPEALAAAIEPLLADAAMQSRMAVAARAAAAARDWEHAATAMEAVYAGVARTSSIHAARAQAGGAGSDG